MAVSNEQLLNFTAIATGPLAQRFLVVKGGTVQGKTPGAAMASAVTDSVIGIAQTDALSGDAIAVCPFGQSKAIAGAAINAWAELTTNASGRVVTAASGDAGLIGYAIEAAAADGDELRIWVQRQRMTKV